MPQSPGRYVREELEDVHEDQRYRADFRYSQEEYRVVVHVAGDGKCEAKMRSAGTNTGTNHNAL